MRTTLLLALILALACVPAQAQAARVVAIVDFTDDGVDSGQVPQPLLSQILAGQLLRLFPASTQVIAGDRVRAAMRARGFTGADLLSPSRAALLAQDLGADWVITGRWAQLRVISRADRDDQRLRSLALTPSPCRDV